MLSMQPKESGKLRAKPANAADLKALNLFPTG
jgi:hypothetical protein